MEWPCGLEAPTTWIEITGATNLWDVETSIISTLFWFCYSNFNIFCFQTDESSHRIARTWSGTGCWFLGDQGRDWVIRRAEQDAPCRWDVTESHCCSDNALQIHRVWTAIHCISKTTLPNHNRFWNFVCFAGNLIRFPTEKNVEIG